MSMQWGAGEGRRVPEPKLAVTAGARHAAEGVGNGDRGLLVMGSWG